MLNREAISKRFFSCYEGKTHAALAKLFDVSQPTVTQWSTEYGVPWSKLKFLSDSQAVSYEWIMEGIEPKHSNKVPIKPYSSSLPFDTAGINSRFLSLFQGMTHEKIAALFKITSGAVSGWNGNFSQVPWKKVDYAVTKFGVTWDWLLDGLEPKYRVKQEAND